MASLDQRARMDCRLAWDGDLSGVIQAVRRERMERTVRAAAAGKSVEKAHVAIRNAARAKVRKAVEHAVAMAEADAMTRRMRSDELADAMLSVIGQASASAHGETFSKLATEARGESRGDALTESQENEFAAHREQVLRDFVERVILDTRRAADDEAQSGGTPKEQAFKVAKAGEAIVDNHAEEVADTEAQASYGAAQFNALVAAGFKRAIWKTVGDDRVRESHNECEEIGAIPLGTPFPNGLLYPGDPTGPLEETMGCRCILVGVGKPTPPVKSSYGAHWADDLKHPRDDHGRWKESFWRDPVQFKNKFALRIRDAIHEMKGRHTRPVAGAIIVNDRGEILMARSSFGGQGWFFPKGGVDEGEDFLEAARREAREEINVDVAQPIGDSVAVRDREVYSDSLGFGSPRKDTNGRNPKIAKGAANVLDVAASIAGIKVQDFAPERMAVFDDLARRVFVTWESEPVYHFFRAVGRPGSKSDEVDEVRWMTPAAARELPMLHGHAREILFGEGFDQRVAGIASGAPVHGTDADDDRRGCLMAMIENVDVAEWATKRVQNLTGDGIEHETHVTVMYGFNPGFDAMRLASLREQMPFVITLGELSVFECPEYDVLKFAIVSPALKDLHERIARQFKADITPSKWGYNPHLTVAYVEKGSNRDWIGATNPFTGKQINVVELCFSPAEVNSRTTIHATEIFTEYEHPRDASGKFAHKTMLEAIAHFKGVQTGAIERGQEAHKAGYEYAGGGAVKDLKSPGWKSISKPGKSPHFLVKEPKPATTASPGTSKGMIPGPACPLDASGVQLMAQRAQKAADALAGNQATPDAVLSVIAPGDPGKLALVQGMTFGDAAHRAMAEFKDTPRADLECLSAIEVKSTPVPGQANCYMATRKLTMGSTSVTGDFRHELGHALHGALMLNPVLNAHIHALHKEAMAKAAANPAGLKAKLTHEFYETAYGVIGRRALDDEKENVAEHYRGYHKAVYRTRTGEDANALKTYRARFPGWAQLWDAWYSWQGGGQ